MTPLYLTHMGMVCPLGSHYDDILKALLKGDQSYLVNDFPRAVAPPAYVGRVRLQLPPIPKAYKKYVSRNNQLALAALQQMAQGVDDLKSRYASHRIGVVVGTSTSGIDEGEKALRHKLKVGHFPKDFCYEQQELGSLAAFIGDFYGLKGPMFSVSTACSSSAKALASGGRLIEAGLCDAVIVGGCDTLCSLTVEGFSALEAVSQGRCRPFATNRDGINIGEGATFFILSKQEKGARLLGVGESSDAYHISAPNPQGTGAIKAMEMALTKAKVKAGDVDYINLHGTGTILNDAMEARGVYHLFGDQTPCSSTKSLTGHMLGAAGACEVGFLWLILQQAQGLLPLKEVEVAPPPLKTQILNEVEALNGAERRSFALKEAQASAQSPLRFPPHVGWAQRDPHLEPIWLVRQGERCSAPSFMNSSLKLLSNSFAFGGANASVLIGALK